MHRHLLLLKLFLQINVFSIVNKTPFLRLKNINVPAYAFKMQHWLLVQNHKSAHLIIIAAGPCQSDDADLLMSSQPDLLTA